MDLSERTNVYDRIILYMVWGRVCVYVKVGNYVTQGNLNGKITAGNTGCNSLIARQFDNIDVEALRSSNKARREVVNMPNDIHKFINK